jgi:hypothetical protein
LLAMNWSFPLALSNMLLIWLIELKLESLTKSDFLV